MGFLKSWGMKIRNYGVGKAINALDLLEPLVTARIELVRAEFLRMDSKEMSTYIIDQFQSLLREHFDLPPK